MLVEIMVFELYPAVEKPTFKCIAKRRIPSPALKVVALTPDRFTCHYEFLVTTWNFVEDTSATVHVYQALMSVRPYLPAPACLIISQIIVSCTTIIAQHAEGIVIVEIPPLHPTGTPAADIVVEPVTPLTMLSHVHALFDDPSQLYTSQSDWHTSPDVPLVLDVFGILVDGSNAYARCLVKPVPGGDTDLPSTLPVLMGISRVPSETWDADFYGRLHFARTHLVRTWPTSSSLLVNAAKIPERRQIEFESKTGWLLELPNTAEVWLYDLDTMSGRMVALTEPTEIRVLDYLLPNV
jgi:hypothetical protein